MKKPYINKKRKFNLPFCKAICVIFLDGVQFVLACFFAAALVLFPNVFPDGCVYLRGLNEYDLILSRYACMRDRGRFLGEFDLMCSSLSRSIH